MIAEFLLHHQQGAICDNYCRLLQRPTNVRDPQQRSDVLLDGLNAALALHSLYPNQHHRLNIQACLLDLQDQVSLCGNRVIIAA